MRVACRHCHHRKVRPGSRGLCSACYYGPNSVRHEYASGSPFARRGVGHGRDLGLKLPKPTTALPGTKAKLAVLAERAARGLALHHPDDAREDD